MTKSRPARVLERKRHNPAAIHTLRTVSSPRVSWKQVLKGPEAVLLEDALAADPDLGHDLDAMLEGLSPRRRVPFLQRIVANLPKVPTAQEAVLLAIGDLPSGGLAGRARPPGPTEPGGPCDPPG